jgi:hypothetical protein
VVVVKVVGVVVVPVVVVVVVRVFVVRVTVVLVVVVGLSSMHVNRICSNKSRGGWAVSLVAITMQSCDGAMLGNVKILASNARVGSSNPCDE